MCIMMRAEPRNKRQCPGVGSAVFHFLKVISAAFRFSENGRSIANYPLSHPHSKNPLILKHNLLLLICLVFTEIVDQQISLLQ